jgi:hypothetical protein
MSAGHGRKAEFPWRGAAVGCLSSAVLLAGHFLAGYDLVQALVIGTISYVGAQLALGVDLLPPPPPKAPTGFTAEAFAELISAAKKRIADIAAANERIPSEVATEKMHTLAERALEIVNVIESDPDKVGPGQKFLSVYLEGMARVSQKYADTHTLADCEKLDAQFIGMLDRAAETCGEVKEKLIGADKLDLDVDMTVFTKRLNFEGV